MTRNDKPQTTRVLIISQDVVGPQMAGPGIRYWEFSRLLGREMRVTLAAPAPVPSTADGFDLLAYDQEEPEPLQRAAHEADAVIAGGYLLRAFPFLLALERPLVVDAYIPYPLEVLELSSQYSPVDQITSHADALSTLNLQFMAGDFFICASERQRDLWLGLMLAQGRINPHTYAQDRTFRHLIDVVPFGLPEQPPRLEKPALRGVNPAVREGDRIILWGGGIWQWLDPLTLIRAISRIVSQRSDVHLFFPGTRHPYAEGVPDMQMRQAATRLSDELGLTGRHVIFGDWMPYQDRQNYLLEADVGVSLHFDTLETRFAFRTRLLDYIWAGLPIVASRGDPLSELVEQHDLGRVVEPEDVDGLATALLELLDVPDIRDTFRPRFEAVAAQLTWPQVIRPLARFCHAPQRALDRRMPDRNIYQAWVSDLQRASRSSSEAQIADLQKHAQTLEGIIQARDEQITDLTQLVDRYSRSLPAKVYAALKQLLGK